MISRVAAAVVTVSRHDGLSSVLSISEWRITEGPVGSLAVRPAIERFFSRKDSEDLGPGEEGWMVKIQAIGKCTYFLLWDKWELRRVVIQGDGSRALKFFIVSRKRWVPLNPTFS